MFRFGLPSFKLLVAGAVAAAALAYHKGLVPDAGRGDSARRPAAAAVRPPVPSQAVHPQRAVKPSKAVVKQAGEKRRTEGKAAQRASAPRPAQGLAMPRPVLTGSTQKAAKPRPPEALPIQAKK